MIKPHPGTENQFHQTALADFCCGLGLSPGLLQGDNQWSKQPGEMLQDNINNNISVDSHDCMGLLKVCKPFSWIGKLFF